MTSILKLNGAYWEWLSDFYLIFDYENNLSDLNDINLKLFKSDLSIRNINSSDVKYHPFTLSIFCKNIKYVVDIKCKLERDESKFREIFKQQLNCKFLSIINHYEISSTEGSLYILNDQEANWRYVFQCLQLFSINIIPSKTINNVVMIDYKLDVEKFGSDILSDGKNIINAIFDNIYNNCKIQELMFNE